MKFDKNLADSPRHHIADQEQIEIQQRAILQSAVDFAIILLDDRGHILDWNSGAQIMFGYEAHEVLGESIELIFTPEDRAGGIPEREIQATKDTGQALDERWHQDKKGHRFFMSGVMTPILGTQAKGFVKIGRNITDRKLAEEALFLSEQRKSLAVQTAQMGQWVWNMASNIIYRDVQTCLLLGLPGKDNFGEADSIIGQVHEKDVPGIENEVRKIKSGLNIFQAEFRVIRADNGEKRWVNAYGRVVGYQGEQPEKMIGVIYDITERKLQEERKNEFIGVASHELKTPVSSIKAYSQILLQTFQHSGDTKNSALLTKLNAKVDQLVKLIFTLLDSTTITEGKMRLQVETVSLNHLIETQLQEFRLMSDEHNLSWKPGVISLVQADQERIGQVVSNFISNAIKYSPRGSEIIVATEDTADGVKVSVQDFGIGIPASCQSQVFDRYYRVTGETDKKSGLGLGLYISSQIIREHHGTIGLESVEGKGTTFYFTLPYS